jgi:H+/Cl- antiporter ClcA
MGSARKSRHIRVLARRHGPTSLVWRRRFATGAGAVLVGLVALLFARAADAAMALFGHATGKLPWLPILITPLGVFGLAAITNWWTPEARGSGIPQVIAAARDPGARVERLLSLKTGFAKLAMTLVALLVGASVGREGPTVQVSASILARVHRLFRVPLTSGVIIAGGAAGVAAAFNTPLAGVAFAIEELANAFEQRVTMLVMTAILISGMVSLGIAGDYVYFGALTEALPVSRVLIIAPVAGFLGGIAGGCFAKLILSITRNRRRYLGPLAARPLLWALICGAGIAVIGMLTGLTWGTGYAASKAIIEGAPAPWYFGPAKFAATALSTLAGMPGGIFSPSIATGAGLGNMLCLLFPHDPRGAVVLLGMIAYFTGVVRAPLTAVIIVMEVTASRGMILPLFASAVIADASAQLICKEKLYHGLAREFFASGTDKKRVDSSAESGTLDAR